MRQPLLIFFALLVTAAFIFCANVFSCPYILCQEAASCWYSLHWCGYHSFFRCYQMLTYTLA
jgi:hypothetical protein